MKTFSLILSVILITVLLLGCSEEESPIQPPDTIDIVGVWEVAEIEGAGPVNSSNSKWAFNADGTYEWFLLFSPFDTTAQGNYTFNENTLTCTGFITNVFGTNINLTISSNNNTFSVLDGDGDRWTYNRKVESTVGVIAHWTFDEMTGNILNDISGNNHHGTITNASWVSGFNSGGLHFEDTSYVTVSYSKELHPSESITVEAIIKLDTFLVDGGSAIVSTNQGGGYGLWNFEGNLDIYININKDYTSVVDSSDFETGKWYHIAGTYDGHKLKFYVNGILKDQVNFLGTITYKWNNALQIGQDASQGNDPEGSQFNGIIDEIRISGDALEPDEFLAIP